MRQGDAGWPQEHPELDLFFAAHDLIPPGADEAPAVSSDLWRLEAPSGVRVDC